MKKGFIEYILLLVILVLLIGGTLYVVRNSNQPSPTPTLGPDAFTDPSDSITNTPVTEGTGSITIPETTQTFDTSNLDSDSNTINSKITGLNNDLNNINDGLNDQIGDLSE